MRFAAAFLTGLALLTAAAPAPAAEDLPRVLVVGAPERGPIAELKLALLAEGQRYEEVNEMPSALRWHTEIILLGRVPSTGREQAQWEAILGDALAVGVGVAARHADSTSGIPNLPIEALGQVVEVPASEAVQAAAERLLLYRPRLRHPMDGPTPGVNPALFQLDFPREPSHLPGSALAFLVVLTGAFLGVMAVVRLQDRGPVAGGVLLAFVSAVGSAALVQSGLLPDAVQVSRLAFEERPRGLFTIDSAAGPGVPGKPVPRIRRIELLRVERVSGSGPVKETPWLDGDGWHEIRYDAGIDGMQRDGALQLLSKGQWALFGRVLAAEPATWEEGTTRVGSDGQTTTTMIPYFGSLRADGETVGGISGEEIHRHRVLPPPPWPALPRMLQLLERHDIPRVAHGARAAGALLRLDGGRFTIRFPKGGPALVVEAAN